MASTDLIKHKHLLTVILIIGTLVQGETYSDSGSNSKFTNTGMHNQFISTSHLITKNNTKIIAQLGGLAVLPCTVKYNSPATVSWIRKRDFQLLTVGIHTYSSDDRFLVEHARHMGHWSLRIKSVRDVDKGLYECQISTHPAQSIFVELKVVEAIADISGAPDLHIDESSTLRLECKLKRATEYPTFVFWFHNNKMVNYDTQDGFSVTTFEPTINIQQQNTTNSQHLLEAHSLSSLGTSSSSSSVSSLGSSTLSSSTSTSPSYLPMSAISILSIREVHFKHGGNYTCSPSNTRPASIMVHVLRGEKPAAMQHANRSSSSSIDDSKLQSQSSKNQPFCFICLLLLNFICIYKINNR